MVRNDGWKVSSTQFLSARDATKVHALTPHHPCRRSFKVRVLTLLGISSRLAHDPTLRSTSLYSYVSGYLISTENGIELSRKLLNDMRFCSMRVDD